ncbi:hypothetical protein [Brassicibacter mesophilus]|uniref:hypothetical protein n=1 Tax=Brassicibacter mesophilus TaxID=745119 RepID=UPI003D1984E5
MKNYYYFERRKGMFDKELLKDIKKVLYSFKKRNLIQEVEVNEYKIKFSSDKEEFYLTPNNTKRVEAKSDFICCILLLIIKKHYLDSFKFTSQCFLENQVEPVWYRGVKYVNKMLNTRIQIINNLVVVR